MATSFGSKDARIHVANALGRDLFVVVMPNTDWIWADLAFSLGTAMLAAMYTGGGSTAIAAEATVETSRILKTVKDIYSAIKELKAVQVALRVYRATSIVRSLSGPPLKILKIASAVDASRLTRATQSADKTHAALRKLIETNAIRIPRGTCQRVSKESLLEVWKVTNPSYFATLFNANTIALLICDENLDYVAHFNSGADDSWIARPDKVVRARYGTLWDEDLGAVHEWNNASPWPGITWTDGIHAAVNHGADRAYFFNFRRGSYLAYDLRADRVEAGYPKPIAEGWKELPWQDGFDAAVGMGNTLYFFRGDEYLAYDMNEKKVAAEHPRKIKDGWPGVWPDGVDAAFTRNAAASGRDRVIEFFNFTRREHVRFNLESGRTEEPLLRPIAGSWDGLPYWFHCAIHGAARDGTAPLYFFQGEAYYRWNTATNRLEDGYPTTIVPGAGSTRRYLGANALCFDEFMRRGDSLITKDGKYQLCFQNDANLVLYRQPGNEVLADSATQNKHAARVALEVDGALTVFGGDGSTMYRWTRGTDEAKGYGSVLLLDEQGTLTVYGRDKLSQPKTEPGGAIGLPETAVPAPRDRIYVGESLRPGQALWSANGEHFLVLRHSGRLQLLRREAQNVTENWSSNTLCLPERCTLEENGNLVLRDCNDQITWASDQAGGIVAAGKGHSLVLRNNGQLVIVARDGLLMWSIGAALNLNEAPRRLEKIRGPTLLVSANLRYRLSFNPDGEHIIFRNEDDEILWRRPGNAIPTRLVRTGSGHACKLVLQDDGELVIHSAQRGVLWRSESSVLKSRYCLWTGELLKPGEFIRSPNGIYEFGLRPGPNGGFSLSRRKDGVWRSKPGFPCLEDESGFRLSEDNFVDTPNATFVYSMGTKEAQPGGRLVAKDDGKLELWDGEDQLILTFD